MRKLRKLLHLAANPAYWKGLQRSVAATTEHEAFLRCQRAATVIDAGANKGQFSLAVRAALPGASILAFEPLPHFAAIFRKVFQDDSAVKLISSALGSQAGICEIHVSRRADSSSLLPIGKQQSQIFPGTEEVAVQKIRVERLDDVLDASSLARPILLKIDVQGFELELLKGAEKSLRQIDGIYVELSFLSLYDGQPMAHDVIAWLAAHGFVLSGVYHICHGNNGQAVQADIHFVNTARCPEAGAPAAMTSFTETT